MIYQEIFQEGEDRGRIMERAEIRKQMTIGLLDEGLSIETIARLTELSIEQIQKIQADRG